MTAQVGPTDLHNVSPSQRGHGEVNGIVSCIIPISPRLLHHRRAIQIYVRAASGGEVFSKEDIRWIHLNPRFLPRLSSCVLFSLLHYLLQWKQILKNISFTTTQGISYYHYAIPSLFAQCPGNQPQRKELGAAACAHKVMEL